MLDKSDYITKMQEELICNKENFSMDDVYNRFEKYVSNKSILREIIELGVLHYDYREYLYCANQLTNSKLSKHYI